MTKIKIKSIKKVIGLFYNIFDSLKAYSSNLPKTEKKTYENWKKKQRCKNISLKVLQMKVANNLGLFFRSILNEENSSNMFDIKQNNCFIQNIIIINSVFLLKTLVKKAGSLVVKRKKSIAINQFEKLFEVIGDLEHKDSDNGKKIFDSQLNLFKSILTMKICNDYFQKMFKIK